MIKTDDSFCYKKNKTKIYQIDAFTDKVFSGNSHGQHKNFRVIKSQLFKNQWAVNKSKTIVNELIN